MTATAALPMLNDTTVHECEQVHYLGTRQHVSDPLYQLSVFEECSEQAKHHIEWGEKDMHPGEMWMCDFHMSEFLQDAEYCEGITWTFVHTV
jgi:hypothetical protein